MGIGLIRKIKELSPVGSQTGAGDSWTGLWTCCFLFASPSRGQGGHSYNCSAYYLLRCVSTFECSTADEPAGSSWVWGILLFCRCNLLQVPTSDVVLKSLLCWPMLSSTLCVITRMQAADKCYWKCILEQQKPNQHTSSTILAKFLEKQSLLCRARYIHKSLVFTFSKITALSLFSTIPSLEMWAGSMRIQLPKVPCRKSKEELHISVHWNLFWEGVSSRLTFSAYASLYGKIAEQKKLS